MIALQEEQIPSAVQIAVWDKGMVWRGNVASAYDLHVVKRRNAPGDCSFTVDADHNRIVDLMTSGARCVVTYQHSPGAPWKRLISGRVQTRAGEGPQGQAVRTITLRDDWSILQTTTAWPNPTKPVDQQSDQAYYKAAGPAETVALDVIRQNYVTRLGQPLIVPTSLGRGTAVSLQFRMDYLADKLFPAVDNAGIILDIGQVGNQRQVDVRVPATYARPLTEGGGVIVGGTFSLDEITATDVIVGLGGTDTARIFRQFTNTSRRVLIGEPLEVFVDASDVALTDDLTAESTSRSTDAFTSNAAKVDLNITLVETGAFKYAKTFDVGDIVSIKLAGLTDPIVDYVRDVEIAWTAEDGDTGGLTVTPHVGDWQDDADSKLINEVTLTAKAVRALQRS